MVATPGSQTPLAATPSSRETNLTGAIRGTPAAANGSSEGVRPAHRRKQARQCCVCCNAVCRYGEEYCLGCKALHGDGPAPSRGVGTGMTDCARRDAYLEELHGHVTPRVLASREAMAAVAALEV